MNFSASIVAKEVVKGVVHLARHKEFYGHVIQQFQKVFVDGDHKVQTAAVGRIPGDRFIKLYLNTQFFTKLLAGERAFDYIVGVLEHETLHCCLGHLFLSFQDPVRGAVAEDLVVNCLVARASLPEGHVHPDMYDLPENKAAVWYYEALKSNSKFQKQCKDGQFGPEGVLSHIMSSHGMWDDLKDDLLSKEFVRDVVRKAKELCANNYGDVPASLMEQVDGFLRREKAIVPWAKVMRLFCASAAESVLDYTVKRISKRYGTRPGTRKGDVLRLAIGIDTSGSTQDYIKTFWNEVRWIWKNGAEVWVYECDCRISERSPFRFKGKWDGTISGLGGTDLEPILEEVEGKYDALIYFTDFLAPPIKRRYNIPTLWVLRGADDESKFPCTWGKRVRIDSGVAVAV